MTTIPATISERVALPRTATPGASGPSGVSPGEFVQMLRSRIVLLMVLSFFFSALATGGFLLWYLKFPSYTASAIIECISFMPKPSYEAVEQRGMQQHEHERFLMSQALFVKQPQILTEVLKDLEVRNTAWFKSLEEGTEVLELERALSSAPVRDTNYIRVAMSTHHPGDPHTIVEKAVRVYLQRVQERAVSQYRSEVSQYKAEQDAIEKQIREKIDQIREFGSTIPPGNQPQGVGRMTVVEAALMDAQAQVTELQLQTLELQGIQSIYDDPNGPGVTPEDRQLVELNPQVQALVNQLMTLEQELRVMAPLYGAEHRQTKTMLTRLEQTNLQLQEMRELKLREAIELKQEQVRTAYFNSQHALDLAMERLIEQQSKQADVERKLAEYERLHDELRFLKETREKVADYIRDVDRIIAERSAVRIDVLQWPTQPLERSTPKWYFAVAGVFLAVGLAVGLTLLLELLDTSVRTPRDIAVHLNAPVLGTIPDADDEEVDIPRIEMAVREVPQSMIAEAFRAVRTSLQFSAPVERMRTILITSPRPEDGKTTVACNLAFSMAMSGRRVLLVDANLRRPAIGPLFGDSHREGLSNVLVGTSRLDDVAFKTDIGNVDVVPSGPTPPNPAERLGSPLMREFLGKATSSYDQVIIDAPPVLLASDAALLATMVDGAILVLRAKENSRGIAQRALTMLTHVSAHIFGVVLNAAQVRRGGYFREQLRTFYDYQEEMLEGGRTPTALPAPSEPEAPKIDFTEDDEPDAEDRHDDGGKGK